jgi:hypothetical protein
MTSRSGIRRAGILFSVGAVILTCGCSRSTDQPAASSQPTDAAPQIGAVSPASGQGRSQAFHVVASHPAGAAAINDLEVLIDERMTAKALSACWIDVRSAKSVAVRNEDGSDWLPFVPIGSAKAAANSKCSIDASGVKVEANGNELALTLPVTFSGEFKQGTKKVWVVASGPHKHSGWQERGTWTVN